jgi:hypothetical protein
MRHSRKLTTLAVSARKKSARYESTASNEGNHLLVYYRSFCCQDSHIASAVFGGVVLPF